MDLYLKDPKTGEKSVTLTAFMSGFVVCIIKLLVSGVTVGVVTLSQFSGGDFGMAVGALGAIYAMRKASDKEPKSAD